MVHTGRRKHPLSAHPLEDHPKYVEAIGMVALETIALEIRLATLFARMLGLPPRVGQAIFLSPKAEQTRLDILRNTAKSWLSVSPSKRSSMLGRQKLKALSDVEGIAARADKLIRRRHRIIHDEWNYSDNEKKVTRKVLDGSPGHPRKPVDIEEVEELINGLRHLIDDAYDLSEAFRNHPPTMADMRVLPAPSPPATVPQQTRADRLTK